MSSLPNPLWGSWSPSTGGANLPPPPNVDPAGKTGTTNPYGMGSRGGGDLGANLAETNVQTGVQKNKLIPWFAQMMSGTAGPAADFFKKLMDFGSPFYKEKQRQTAEQGAKAGNEQAGMARERLSASGAGYGPSGAGAAMFGGMGQAEAGNQEEAFLNNLFQNEQLQALGASGLSQLASLFNPSPMATSSTNPNIQQPTNTFAETAAGIGQLMGGIFGSGGVKK